MKGLQYVADTIQSGAIEKEKVNLQFYIPCREPEELYNSIMQVNFAADQLTSLFAECAIVEASPKCSFS
jgi:hypothetical protein